MIFTCTLNPSVDYFVHLDQLQLGRVNMSDSESMMPGGKGINVSRVLKRLGHSSRALGFLGGFTGRFIEEELDKEHIDHDFVQVPGSTRINVKLKSEDETEINGQSPEVGEDALESLFGTIDALSKGDVLILSGSVPGSVSSDIYNKILGKAQAKGVITALDTKGEPLKKALAAQPFLIKPNHHELGDLFGVNISSFEESAYYARKLVNLGARNVIVSMAGEGAVFVNQSLAMQSTVPQGNVINSVGAGDSVVAGFIASYLKNGDIKAAFQYGVTAGSASAFSEGFCTAEQVETLLGQVKVQTI